MQTQKRCTKCKRFKILPKFGKDRSKRDGLRLKCKKCRNEEAGLYQKTKFGLITKIYADQRKSSRRRKHVMPTYTNKELKEWCFNQNLFHELYDNWVKSGYNKMLIPSCDRTDDYLGYSLNRLELKTWRENKEKGESDRVNGINNKRNKSVIQFTKEGLFLSEFHSAMEAKRRTKISNISTCCLGKRRLAGGFNWAYK